MPGEHPGPIRAAQRTRPQDVPQVTFSPGLEECLPQAVLVRFLAGGSLPATLARLGFPAELVLIPGRGRPRWGGGWYPMAADPSGGPNRASSSRSEPAISPSTAP